MKTRDENLLKLRPQLANAKVTDNMSSQEQFQNRVLRPIIKMQSDLFIRVFRNYIRKGKNTFYELNLEKRITYVQHTIQRDQKFRNILKGIIIGQFTLEEYQEYIEDSSALNKRMMNIVKERLLDNIQLLEGTLVH